MPLEKRTARRTHEPRAALSASSDPVTEALARALPVLAGLFSAIVDHKLGSRAAVEPPIVACDTCGLDARTVRRLMRAGKLAAVKAGRRWFASPEALRALLPASRPVDIAPANESTEPMDTADRTVAGWLADTGLELASRPSSGAASRRSARR